MSHGGDVMWVVCLDFVFHSHILDTDTVWNLPYTWPWQVSHSDEAEIRHNLKDQNFIYLGDLKTSVSWSSTPGTDFREPPQFPTHSPLRFPGFNWINKSEIRPCFSLQPLKRTRQRCVFILTWTDSSEYGDARAEMYAYIYYNVKLGKIHATVLGRWYD